jgi:hypothetical protein
MFTYMLYRAERPKTAQERRELDAINGEIALAIMRPFRSLRRSWRTGRPVMLSISQSQHSLEDIYLGPISQDTRHSPDRRLPAHAPK